MDAAIIPFPGEMTVDEPVDAMLEKAKAWGMTQCTVIGFKEDGELIFGGSTSDMGNVLLMLEGAKHQIMQTLFSQT